MNDLRPIRRREPRAAAAQFGAALHPVLCRVYGARGLTGTDDLRLELARLLPVGTLEGIEPAVDLLLAHRDGSVLVIGDFDADGATSTALVVRALRGWGYAAVDFLVPNRFEFGYGLTPEIVELAARRSPTLIVTVDNGISSHAGVQRARDLGIAVLITDHHLPARTLPPANVIVNPNLQDSTFASRALAGVGVAFYVVAALRRRLAALGCLPVDAPAAAELLDLVALGTVADLVPLDANNRVLVAQGLARIRAGRCVPGISVLLEMAGRSPASITAADLGFAVAPRLNAAGRLDDMSIGIRCLLATDAAEARDCAARLEELNVERRSIEARMQALAVVAVRGIDLPTRTPRQGITLYDPGWHQGVVGLVAGRIKDRVRRPVVAFAQAGVDAEGASLLRGSARSVAGVHVRDVLDAVATREPDLIVRFGGHAMAAGLTLAERNLDRFAAAFDAETARWMRQVPDDAIETDGALAEEEIALATARVLRAGGPWGQGFPEPCFDGVFHVKSRRIVGNRHVKLRVQLPASGASFEAIAFNYLDEDESPQRSGIAAAAGRSLPEEGSAARLVYRLDINDYLGEERLQLLVDHLQPAP